MTPDKPAKLRLTRAERSQATRAGNRLLALLRRDFPSATQPHVVYHAMIMGDGRLTCDCRGWTIKKLGKPRECKHTKALAKEYGGPLVIDGEYLRVQREEGP